jgi:serine protease Do
VGLKVTVREAPDNYGVRPVRRDEDSPAEDRAQFNSLGLEVAPLTDDVARELRLKNADGVVITAVEEGSPADLAGLETSMAIVRVGEQNIRSVEDFDSAMKDSSLERGVLLLIRSAEGSRFVVVKSE